MAGCWAGTPMAMPPLCTGGTEIEVVGLEVEGRGGGGSEKCE